MEKKYLEQIAGKLHLSFQQVSRVDNLHAEGATIPFMARYRKEATGNLDEVAIGHIVEEILYFQELEKRKETVIKTIEEAGKLTPELKKRIDDCFNATELEDIYLPYKPKRKTRASQAIDKGLEPLARLIFDQGPLVLEEEAAKYITEEVKDIKDALQGARDIMAEWISESEAARAKARQLFTETAVVTSQVVSTKKRRRGRTEIPGLFCLRGAAGAVSLAPAARDPAGRERRLPDDGYPHRKGRGHRGAGTAVYQKRRCCCHGSKKSY